MVETLRLVNGRLFNSLSRLILNLVQSNSQSVCKQQCGKFLGWQLQNIFLLETVFIAIYLYQDKINKDFGNHLKFYYYEKQLKISFWLHEHFIVL